MSEVMGVRDRLRARYAKPGQNDLLAPYVPPEPMPELPKPAKPKRAPRVLITQPTDAPESDIRACRDCGAHIEKGRWKCDACRDAAQARREAGRLRRRSSASAARREASPRTCVVCGKDFIGRPNAVCCSDECRRIHKINRTRATERIRHIYPQGMACPRCGTRTTVEDTRTVDEVGTQRRKRACTCGFIGWTVERWEAA